MADETEIEEMSDESKRNKLEELSEGKTVLYFHMS